MKHSRQKKVLLFVAVDWYFCMHWLPLAKAVQNAGFEVVVMTEITDQEERIRNAGLRVIPIRLSRKGINPLAEIRSFYSILRVFRREQPDLAHNIAQKPVVYGTLAAKIAGVESIVDTLPGLGFLFTSQGIKARLLRPLLRVVYRFLLRRDKVRLIVQNPDDQARLQRLAKLDSVLIRSAGVDLDRFLVAPEPEGVVTVILASRLLWDKGVGEFVAAARMLERRGVKARFVLVGKPDPGNPGAVDAGQLGEWDASGDIEWWGFREDMPEVVAQCHIVCLPSYYQEGLPTILIEGAAVGRPLVTTDHTGCREAVRDGENGFLVPPRDPQALAVALERLIRDPALRARFGRRSRMLAEEQFSIDRVTAATLGVYSSVLDPRNFRSTRKHKGRSRRQRMG
jgi:glycosyltransferase involved in cell wall biosynthesis